MYTNVNVVPVLVLFLVYLIIKASWIVRIHFFHADPDPGEPSLCKSVQIWIQIRITAYPYFNLGRDITNFHT